HSGLLTLDFDHVSNLDGLKKTLLSDRYFDTELMFVSPSGDGLKWVISIDLMESSHQQWFAS
ncbi:MAG TPA: VirE protein, partial [Prolixibacteraceae bacterium]|nr:VirE protein [Prolixibacteraceae bacterium]